MVLATPSFHSCLGWLELVLISGTDRNTSQIGHMQDGIKTDVQCTMSLLKLLGTQLHPRLQRHCAIHRSLYITIDDRSSWESLTSQVIPLMQQLTDSQGPRRKLTLVAESFGGCLAWRLALAVPDLIANMVVLNSATCFDKSYGGIINLIAASKLLSLFPEQLYQVSLDISHSCLQPENFVRITCMQLQDMHTTVVVLTCVSQDVHGSHYQHKQAASFLASDSFLSRYCSQHCMASKWCCCLQQTG